MEALIRIGFSFVSFGLFLWALNALSVVRNQMDDVIARLECIERGQQAASAHLS